MSKNMHNSLAKIQGQNRTIPGKVISSYPTIRNLSIEWYIQGDDNQNGVVLVRYREKAKLNGRQECHYSVCLPGRM
jgi:hypothetical protein